MSNFLSSATTLANVSKHASAGIAAIVIGVLAVGFGLVKAAVRAAMLAIGVIIVVLGILLATRTI
jgi:hypothetical protein